MGLASFNRMRREMAEKVKADPLDHDGNGKKGGAPKQEPSAELTELRAAYKEKLNKNPFMGWDADTLKAKIAEAAGA